MTASDSSDDVTPTLTVTPSTVYQGEDVTMSCHYTANSVSKIYFHCGNTCFWRIDVHTNYIRATFSPKSRVKVLTQPPYSNGFSIMLQGVNVNDDGLWRCEVHSDAGEFSSNEKSLNVHGECFAFQMLLFYNDNNLRINECICMICT